MANVIKVTAVDNELILVAYQWGASFEICRILSGNGQAVNCTINIVPGQFQGTLLLNGITTPLSGNYNITLAAGTYSLVGMGIDWGGPQIFTFNLNGTTYTSGAGSTGDGLVWNTKPIPMTV